VVIVPIPKPLPELLEKADEIAKDLKARGIRVKIDSDDSKRPGFKFAEHEMKGIPVRIGIGPRDLEKGQAEIARRDTKEKTGVPLDGLGAYVENLLEEIQNNLLAKAKAFRAANTHEVDSYDEFKTVLEEKGGFILAHWDGSSETELKVKEETKATIRCIPLEGDKSPGTCMVTGKPSAQRVIFAKAY